MDVDPLNLPPLRGSAKQVKWATTIRASFLKMIERQERSTRQTIVESRSYGRQLKYHAEREHRAFTYIRSQTAASWWIERRALNLYQLSMKAQAEIGG
jgi:hypothetical protein